MKCFNLQIPLPYLGPHNNEVRVKNVLFFQPSHAHVLYINMALILVQTIWFGHTKRVVSRYIQRMKDYSVVVAFNATFFTIFMLLLSYSNYVEARKSLRDQYSSPSFIALFINRAYSGPSRKGRGHWRKSLHSLQLFSCFLTKFSSETL